MMKRITWIGLLLLIAFGNVLHADYIIYSGDPNACESLPGVWKGTGKGTNRLISCTYHGTGTVGPLDNKGRFTINLIADKDSGSMVCPKHALRTFSGICTKGIVKIITDQGTLNGRFSKNSGHVQGTLHVLPTMNVDVDIQFNRAQ